MKYLLTTAKTALLLLLLNTCPLQAATPGLPGSPATFEATIFVNRSQKICLAIEKLSGLTMAVTLRQVGAKEDLFTQQIGRKKTKIALRLDVEQLPDGLYELEIKAAGSERIYRQLTLRTTTPVLTSERSLAIL